MSGRTVVKVMVPPMTPAPRGAEAFAEMACLLRRGWTGLKRRMAVRRDAPAAGRAGRRTAPLPL
jgi:hypothetical protein